MLFWLTLNKIALRILRQNWIAGLIAITLQKQMKLYQSRTSLNLKTRKFLKGLSHLNLWSALLSRFTHDILKTELEHTLANKKSFQYFKHKIDL